ncbi:hypothetical protein L873DRAFT_1832076 [Choiromyces venosus 120613-1]|uniref:SAP domain-containing protein n=1 Tax=Choiromyces venosus 120613-1 TaxID=1336337 RepID=A0A3N4ITK9_9PEZI|nr:hypothetical protein L873DRAFT_1832076 [Choiromyces venosus 120613-1]
MPPKSTNVEDLQKQCKSAGLDATGNKADLVKGVKNQKKQENREALSPGDQDDPKCDAILVTKSKTGSEEAMKNEAKDALGQALQDEELKVEKVRGEHFISNRHGLGFAGVSNSTRGEQESSSGRGESALENEVKFLKGYSSILKLSIGEYCHVWNRFISTFKRDKLNNATGNTTAHGGDAIVDALLYEGLNGRCDPSTFNELYGLHPGDVLKITDIHKTGTAEFYQRFAQFIQLFEGSNYDESYLTAGPQCADVAHTYWSLLDCQRYQDSA